MPAAGQWPKRPSDLIFVRLLGRGYFGEVWECTWPKAPSGISKTYAVKKVPKSIIQQHGLTEQMDREIVILRSLDHPRIVRLFFDFHDDAHVYLGMEFVGGGGMFDALCQRGKFPLDVAAQYFHEVCDALSYIHNLPEKVIHRDIKPENVLLDSEGHAKLADFGWSNKMESSYRATFCGTPDYLAPEMIRGEGHNESLDMWEMGVLLYEMVVGKSPFGGSSHEETAKKILKRDLRFPPDMDKDAMSLIVGLCRINPDERLSAAQAMRHPFLARYQHASSESTRASPHDEGQPSVQTRKARRDREILEDEMRKLLEAKSETERAMLRLSVELEEVYERLRNERRLRSEAETVQRNLQDREAWQRAEIAELRRVLDSRGGYASTEERVRLAADT